MPTLYTLHLSRHVRGMVKGPVKAEPAKYAGHWREHEKDIMRPNSEAMRECLPHYYRKAFDRESGSLWFPRDGQAPAHITLRSSRGKYLNTLYAQPVHFEVDTAKLTA